jgi:hypothetical protein
VEHGRQALANVVAGERELFLLEAAVLLGPLVDGARERGPESGEVRAAFVRVDVVHEGQGVVVVAVVVLHRALDLDPLALRLERDGLGMQ